ncbi:protein of unknown function DUF1524 RloF [Thermosediminibacter oceani DSM 16646]|uniref:DUF1524 domain-containing protein n=2 Tax=Thermosediminibacter TaxID=291988 RepID=D9RZB6_THEOJ|nr:protein of unknown function DUF1524 RloF [Thermosediminibacter oceani DSM 16646]
MTTIIILLHVILSKFKDEDLLNYELVKNHKAKYLYQEAGDKYKSYIFGYEKDNPSDEFFKTEILDQKSITAHSVAKETLYTANLKRAKDFFIEKIRNMDEKNIEILFKKVVNGLKFNLYEIDDDLDVFITFETMNNRGKPLSKLELLKNRLIYLSTLIPENEDIQNKLRREINEVWKTIYEYLGKNKDNPLDDDEFLENHWIMYFKYERGESEAYAKFLLDKYFIAKNVLNPNAQTNVGFKEIKDYIDSLAESVKAWFYMFNPAHSNSIFNKDIIEWLQKLQRLGFGAFKPLIMAAIVKKVQSELLLELLKTCERFIFLVFSISRRPSNTQNSHFYRVAHDFYTDSWDIKTVINDINSLTNDVDSGGWYDIKRFYDYIDEQFKKAEGFYSWNALRYFLYEYELYLQEKANGPCKVIWEIIKEKDKRDTIEHIYPQDDSDKYWQVRFGKFSPEQRKVFVNSLGNLLLISQLKNSQLQNKGFDFKKEHEDRNNNYIGYCNGSHSEIEVARYNEWTEKEIKDRGIKLLKFMEERWGIQIPDKEKLLGF